MLDCVLGEYAWVAILKGRGIWICRCYGTVGWVRVRNSWWWWCANAKEEVLLGRSVRRADCHLWSELHAGVHAVSRSAVICSPVTVMPVDSL